MYIFPAHDDIAFFLFVTHKCYYLVRGGFPGTADYVISLWTGYAEKTATEKTKPLWHSSVEDWGYFHNGRLNHF